jgi:hypothetical protein
VNDELERILEGIVYGLILRYYPGIFLKRLRKITRNLCQDSRSPGRDLNPGPTEWYPSVYVQVLQVSFSLEGFRSNFYMKLILIKEPARDEILNLKVHVWGC